jgi:hypothetical protein
MKEQQILQKLLYLRKTKWRPDCLEDGWSRDLEQTEELLKQFRN